MLDIMKRPAEVHKWQKEGRKIDGMPDVTDDIDEFSRAWFCWWKSLQPRWRIDGNGDLTEEYDVPEGCDWAGVQKGGPNGFYMLLLTLGWWGIATEDRGQEAREYWGKAFFDIDWVLHQMLSRLIEESEDPETEAPTQKRYVLCSVNIETLTN